MERAYNCSNQGFQNFFLKRGCFQPLGTLWVNPRDFLFCSQRTAGKVKICLGDEFTNIPYYCIGEMLTKLSDVCPFVNLPPLVLNCMYFYATVEDITHFTNRR